LPISSLYERYQPPLIELLPQKKNLKPNSESLEFHVYKDPRLHHLNANFSRENLQIKNFDFTEDPESLKAAFDEIIKLNCNINEFNYMHELAKNIRYKLMPEILKTNVADWAGIF
jgi:hypothetical protein